MLAALPPLRPEVCTDTKAEPKWLWQPERVGEPWPPFGVAKKSQFFIQLNVAPSPDRPLVHSPEFSDGE